MKSYINKKGFTLVELLAVIVVLAIVMALAATGISNILDDFKKNSFVADATSFLHGAHQLVASESNNLFGADGSSGYAPNCSSGTSLDERFIPVSAINVETGGVKSPYGNKYMKGTSTAAGNKDQSYIKVTAQAVSDASGKIKCQYTYYIYLTDGVYSIGGTGNPVEEKDVNNTKVQLDAAPPSKG